MPLSPRGRHNLLLALLVAGAAYRLWGFWGASFWIDEFVTEWILRGDDLGEVTRRANYAYMPPLYFWLSVPFVKVLGLSAVSVRLPAVLFGVLGLLTLHRLVRVTCGRRVALGAVALAAAHPEALWYSQEARVYSFGMMVAPIAIEGAWSAVRTGRRAALVRYVAASAVLAWAHNLFVPIVAILAGWLLLSLPRPVRWSDRAATLDLRRWLAAHAAILAACAPPLWWALETVLHGRIPRAPMPPATLEKLAEGWRLEELGVLLGIAVLASMAWERVRSRWGTQPVRHTEPRPTPPTTAIALFAALLLGVPLIQTALGVALERPFYMVRYRMPVAMLIAPLVAWLTLSVLPLRRPALAMGLLAALVHLVFPVRMLATLGQASYHQVDTRWDDVLAALERELGPDTVVLFQNPLQEWVHVDVAVDADLEGLLLSPVRSHYLRSRVPSAFALPPAAEPERLERVVAARLQATDAARVVAVGWGPLPVLDAPRPGGPLDPADGWRVRRTEVWSAVVYVAAREGAALAGLHGARGRADGALQDDEHVTRAASLP